MSSKKNKKIQKAKKVIKKSVVKKVAKKKPVAKKIVKKVAVKKTKQVKKEIKKVKKVAIKKTTKVELKKVAQKKVAQKKVAQKKVAPKIEVKEKKPVTIAKITSETKVTAAAPLVKIFKNGDYAVYPSHGVGKITDLQSTMVLGKEFSCYLMFFEKEKLTIKIPADSISKVGLRPLATKAQMDEVFAILRSGVKKLKGMWSRRAQEYETKINSGDIILLAEVLRDLTRDIEDGERSYSERIIYETAIARLASEYSAIYNIDFEEAKEKVVATAKDKLGSETKASQKDEFDEFDYEDKDIDGDEEESDEESEELDSDEDDEYEDEDEDEDERPTKRARR